MSKKEEGLDKLMDRVRQINLEREERRKIDKRINRELESKHLQAKRIYDQWVKKHKVPSQKAAKIIFNFYQELINSPTFKDVAATLSTYKNIKVSERTDCFVPSNLGGGSTQTQSLTIDCKGRLFVHNHGKYGKAYQISNVEDLLNYVLPPILIRVSETITNETIWDIIDIP